MNTEQVDSYIDVSLYGSLLDKFLRRCLISYGQMMFENICELYAQYIKFINREPYSFLHSTV